MLSLTGLVLPTSPLAESWLHALGRRLPCLFGVRGGSSLCPSWDLEARGSRRCPGSVEIRLFGWSVSRTEGSLCDWNSGVGRGLGPR